MKLGILETGAPPEPLSTTYGDYPAMFRALLGDEAYDYSVFDVAAGEFPKSPQDHDAYLITGSAAGVYDPLPWIPKLTDFLVATKGKAALVGVCFGHQIMAQAFGGKAAKAPVGWGVGLQDYQVRQRDVWMDGAPDFRVAGSHQDQVLELPPAARVLAGNDFCPNGMLIYDDQSAISLQLHPEFRPDYAKALIEKRRGHLFSDALADKAIASYAQPNDHARVGGWFKRFLAGRR